MHDLQTIIAINAEPQRYRAGLEADDSVPAPKRKPTADLKNWMLTGRTGSDEQNPNNGFILAYGRIFNDERGRWPDNYEVRTSVIVKVDTKAMQIETLNTIYNLK